MEESLFTSIFLIIAKRMIFKGNLLFDILLNKMELQKGRIKLLNKWQKAWLPNKFWVKVVNTVAYILNRSPTKAVRNQTPFEAWHKQKPDVSHLKVFGSITYALIPSQSRDKFDEKGEKLIFIGYNDESKAFRLFNPKKDQLLISKDVIFFYESATWKWEDSVNPESAILELFQTPKQHDVFNSQNEGSSSSSNDELDSESHPTRARPLIDIYNSCHVVFLSGEPQNFEEVVRKKKNEGKLWMKRWQVSKRIKHGN